MTNDVKRKELKTVLWSIMETLDCTIDYLTNNPLAPLTVEQREAKIWAMTTVKAYLEPLYLIYEKVGAKV